MILTPEQVKILLVSVLERITGLPRGCVIRETESGPAPSAPLWCSLWWKNLDPLPQNHGEYCDPDPAQDPEGRGHDLSQYLRNESWCTVQVSFWGKGAFDMAVATIGALQNDNRNFDLWRVLGYGGIERVQDISTSFHGRIQPRCYFDLSFYACFGAHYPVAWFDTSQWAIDVQTPPDPNGQRHPEHFDYSKEIHDATRSVS